MGFAVTTGVEVLWGGDRGSGGVTGTRTHLNGAIGLGSWEERELDGEIEYKQWEIAGEIVRNSAFSPISMRLYPYY